MELDGRTLDGSVLETDVCVVGAGPAGLTVAHALGGGSLDVLVLESGGPDPEAAPQRLNEARTVGDRYAGLQATRHRQIGGTVYLWNTPVGGLRGAKYVALDPADVKGLPELPWSGWPLEWSELEPWYGQARRLCGLPVLDEDGSLVADPDRRPFDLGEAALETRIYELGSGEVFTKVLPDELRRASNVRLCHHATLTQLVPGRDGERVEEAVFGGLDGARFRVRARVFVLAAGAVENPRILLASKLGGTGDWIGRCFMEHPRDYALTLRPRPGLLEEAGFYDVHVDPRGAHLVGRLALPDQIRRSDQIPNVSVTLLPRRRRWPWERRRDAALTLLLNLEQQPHRENRVVLASRRDRLGVPIAELRWRWREDDQQGLERTRAAVAREIEAAGLGRVEVATMRPDPNAHHHAGTTRMSLDATSGGVDTDGRVHDTANLFVCGASVFPTAGFANPSLTIVALALRLAAGLETQRGDWFQEGATGSGS
jgi:choline dehydrogenase-like flavoprotein